MGSLGCHLRLKSQTGSPLHAKRVYSQMGMLSSRLSIKEAQQIICEL